MSNTLRLNEMKLNIRDEAEWKTVYENQRARVETAFLDLEALVDFAAERGYTAPLAEKAVI